MATNIIKVEASSVQSVDTNLNLANSAIRVSSEINNVPANSTTKGYEYAKFLLNILGVSTTPSAFACINIYFLQTIDGGTTYETGSISQLPAKSPDLVIPLLLQTGAQLCIKECKIPTGKFKVLIENQSGGTLTTNSTLSFLTNTYQTQAA